MLLKRRKGELRDAMLPSGHAYGGGSSVSPYSITGRLAEGWKPLLKMNINAKHTLIKPYHLLKINKQKF